MSGGAQRRRLPPPAAVLILAAAALAACLPVAQAQTTSSLWGAAGERWSATGRLADMSYAGYGAGELPIPQYRALINVKSYGAKGDNVTDDSLAFVAAIRAAQALAANLTTRPCPSAANPAARCPLVPDRGWQNEGAAGVAVWVPPGIYRITRMLEITASNVVVRGAGPGRSVLYFPRGLKSIYGNQMAWEFAGGFINILGPVWNSTHTQHKLASLTANVARGSRRLTVSSTAGFSVGQWVRIMAAAPLAPAPASAAGRRLAAALLRRPPLSLQPRSGRRLQQAAPTGGSGGAPVGGLRLSPAAQRSWMASRAVADAMAANHEHEHGAVGAMPAADAAPAMLPAGTLDAWLHGENAVDSGTDQFPLERIRFASRVAAVGAGWVELERPLIHDLRTGWQVGVYAFHQDVQHSGWEGFTLHFRHTPYPSHFVVEGMNGVYLSGCANCWARNMHIINADSGGEAINADFVTLSGISTAITAPRGGPAVRKDCHGHHGLWAAHSTNVLITSFDIRAQFWHDLTLDVFASECVVSNGKGLNVNGDMHRGAVNHCLWTNLDLGKGSRPFDSGGAKTRGSHAARGNVWWGLSASRRASTAAWALPQCDYGPLLTWVGNFSPVGACPAQRWLVEARRGLSPPNLHVAMVNSRVARLGAQARKPLLA